MSRRRREIPIFRTAETLRPSGTIEHAVSPTAPLPLLQVLLPPLRVLRQTYLTSTFLAKDSPAYASLRGGG